MPFIPVAKTVEAEIRMTLDGQRVENTLYFEYPGTVTPSDLTVLGSALDAWWQASYSTQASLAVELREIYLTDLTSATGPSHTHVPAVTALGDLNEEPLPNNVSICVSFRTDLRGRSFRGRNYFVGLVGDQVVGNTLEPAVVTAIRGIYLDLLTLATDNDIAWVVVSRFSGVGGTPPRPIPRVAGVTTPITSVVLVDPVIDSQRRRLPSRGT